MNTHANYSVYGCFKDKLIFGHEIDLKYWFKMPCRNCRETEYNHKQWSLFRNIRLLNATIDQSESSTPEKEQDYIDFWTSMQFMYTFLNFQNN